MSSEEATASAATAIEPVAGTKRSRGNEVGEEVPEPKRSKIVVPIIEADPIDTPEGLTEINIINKAATLAGGPTPSNLKIDYQQDYYMDLGVEPSVSQGAIALGFISRWDAFSPRSPTAQPAWSSDDMKVQITIARNWLDACKAYFILSTPLLRAQYNAGRGQAIPPRAAIIPGFSDQLGGFKDEDDPLRSVLLPGADFNPYEDICALPDRHPYQD